MSKDLLSRKEFSEYLRAHPKVRVLRVMAYISLVAGIASFMVVTSMSMAFRFLDSLWEHLGSIAFHLYPILTLIISTVVLVSTRNRKTKTATIGTIISYAYHGLWFIILWSALT
jgi:RimJ/RimL family protein N-acetyltransferase